MRIAVAQVNPRVGDLSGNMDKMLDYTRRAAAADADLVVFGAGSLTGAHIAGLVDSHAFVEDAHEHLRTFAMTSPIPALVSCASVNELDADTLAIVPELFLAGERSLESLGAPELLESDVVPVIELADCNIAVLFDGHFEPDTELSNVDVLVEMNRDAFGDPMAAPAARGDLRPLSALASECGAHVVSANQCGAADSVVFAGNSTVTAPNGSLMHASPIDEEDLFVFDTAPGAVHEVQQRPAVELDIREIVWRALVIATHDYVHKNGFTDIVIGLSGGIDSSVVAAIAVDALGAAHVHGVAMPGPYSSEASLSDARSLAANLGITCDVIPITGPLEAFESVLAQACGGSVNGLAAENLQARVRTVELMTIANSHGWLMLNCGNKSEAAMGFSTLYGDTAGAFAPIGDIYKTEVYELAQWRNTHNAVIPQSAIDKEPSAELYEGARDIDRLPPYDKLDELLEAHIEDEMGAAELIEAGFDPELVETVLKTVQANEYKRRSEPIAPHVLGRSFTRDRAWPITNGWVDPALA